MLEVDVLNQLRAWRDEFALKHDCDLHRMAETLRALDDISGQPVIHGTPRRPVVTLKIDHGLAANALGSALETPQE